MARNTRQAPPTGGARLNVDECAALYMLIQWGAEHGHEELAAGCLQDLCHPLSSARDKIKAALSTRAREALAEE